MQKYWWKITAFVLLIYSIFFGLTTKVPYDAMIEDSIRNVFYHVPMWFCMVIMFTISFIYAIKYLNKLNPRYEIISFSFAVVGIVFCLLGILTGMVWARVAWNTYWNNDPKLIGAAFTLLIYLALTVLRLSVKDEDKRGRLTAVYNVFAYFLMFPAIYIVPGLMTSSHPGGANDDALMVFKMYPNLRAIFYPAVIGWALVGVWLATLRTRIAVLKQVNND